MMLTVFQRILLRDVTDVERHLIRLSVVKKIQRDFRAS
jgi:hypothetical protein